MSQFSILLFRNCHQNFCLDEQLATLLIDLHGRWFC